MCVRACVRVCSGCSDRGRPPLSCSLASYDRTDTVVMYVSIYRESVCVCVCVCMRACVVVIVVVEVGGCGVARSHPTTDSETIVVMYLCMYKLYLMMVKTWLQSNLSQGRLGEITLD